VKNIKLQQDEFCNHLYNIPDGLCIMVLEIYAQEEEETEDEEEETEEDDE